MGTPDFAVPALKALAQSRHEVSLVVTQPDRQQGRSRKVVPCAVKICAQQYGLPVFQPERVKRPENAEVIREQHPDLIVVAAYGQILSQEILDIPERGCINIHGSLLPQYRGAAPIQWSVINGDEKSGLTIMQMDAGMDTGDILMQWECPLEPKETAQSLYEKLSDESGRLILKALDDLEAGRLHRIPQDNAKATMAPMLDKRMGEIRWSDSAVKIERLVRGLNSWPSAYTYLNGKQLKIWESDATDAGQLQSGSVSAVTGAEAGMVAAVAKDRIYVQTGDGLLSLGEVQLEGKKRMPVRNFLLGTQVKPGTVLGR